MYQNIVKKVVRAKKTLLSIFALTLGLIIIASTQGIGYYGVRCKMERTSIIKYQAPLGPEGTVTSANIFIGTFQVSFNPLLYPVTFVLTRNGTISFPFMRWAEPWDEEGKSIVEMLTLRTIVEEVGRNFLYFVGVSALIVFKLRKIYFKIHQKPFKK